MSIVLSVLACFGWGIADFIGGFKSRTMSTLIILLVSTLTGCVFLALILWFVNKPFPADPLLVWAIPAGITGLAAISMLYRSLAVGTISILAPISASGVILPVIWGLCSGDTVSGLSLFGIIIAISGSLMAVIEKDPEKNTKKLTKGIGLATGSAVLVGIYFITMDRACTFHPIWASMITRVSTIIVLAPVIFFMKPGLNTGKTQLGFLIFMGLMDTSAAFCFALASSKGMLSQVAVISSLYPAVTVILSTIIAKERIRKIQGAGVFLAITGIALISAF